jgi:hypothetical protein
LLSLAAAGRKGMSPELVLAHTQRIIGGLDVLAGVRVAEQAAGMTNVWPVLGAALDSLPGHDVVADLGRIGATTPQSALLRASRMLVMVTTAEPSAVVHLRERLAMLAPTLDPSSPVGTPISVVVIAPPRQTDAVDQVRDALQRTEVPVQAVWHVAHDDKGAGFFRGHFTGRADRTLLVRSTRSVTERLATAVAPFFRPGGEAGTDDSVPDAAVTAPPEPSAPSKVRDESAPGVTR